MLACTNRYWWKCWKFWIFVAFVFIFREQIWKRSREGHGTVRQFGCSTWFHFGFFAVSVLKKGKPSLQSLIVEIVAVVQEWFRTNSIQLNLTKTNLVYFGNALLPEVGMNCEVFAFTGYPRRPTRLRSAFSFIKNSYTNSLQKSFCFSSTGLDTSFQKVEDY